MSSDKPIPDEVLDIMKSIAVIVNTRIYVPSTPVHTDIINQYKITIVLSDITLLDKIYKSQYTEYLIVDWILIKNNNELYPKFTIPILTIPAPNDQPTYTFDIDKLNQRDFLAYTIKNKWRRIDINTAANMEKPVDLHFYLSVNSSYNMAIKKTPARVQGRLNVDALSNKATLHQLIINTPNLLKYIPESIIILNKKIDPDNKNVKVVPTSTEPWIWRPEFGFGGLGIEVVTSKAELDKVIDKYEFLSNFRFVLSRYITNTKLIKNPENGLLYKFHVRLWAIVSIDKYDIRRFALFNTSQMATAKEPYINSDYTNRKIHDTHSNRFENSFFPDCFPGTEHEKDTLIIDIRNMFKDIFEAVSNDIATIGKCESGFQILGIDMMVTDENKPLLIEINNLPGLPGYDKSQYPNYTTRISKEFYSGLWDTVINPLVTGAPMVENHKNITLLYTSE